MHSVRRRSAALAAVVIVGAVLTGCVGQDPKPTPTPTPKATPLYSSDEEALAAAKVAYAKYVEVSNAVAHDGWADLSPLKTVATGDALKADQEAGATNREKGLRIVGDATGVVKSVQQVSTRGVTAYACFDVSSTTVVDSSGADQTSPSRVAVVPFEVRFARVDSDLRLERNDPWSGKSFCV